MRSFRKPRPVRFAREVPFLTLCVLLVSAFLLGGGSRADILSLVVLRPIAIVCLAIGIVTVSREQIAEHRFVVAMTAAIVALIGLHLVPLPPVIWTALPGREVAEQAGALVGLEGVWRPLTLSPHRGWNAFYAMSVPAAVVLLAIQLDAERHRFILYLVLGIATVSAILAVAQVASGFNTALYPYRLTSIGRPVGLFANRNHQAAFLCAAVPMLIMLALRAKAPLRAIIHSAAAAITLAFVLLTLATGSRGGLIGLAIAALASLAYLRALEKPVGKREPRSNKSFYLIGVLIVAIVVLLGILFFRSEAVDRVATEGVAEEYRFFVWYTVAGFMGQYMPFGSGAGSFVEVFKLHEPRELLGFAYWNHAHNDWIEWILEFGFAGLALSVVVIVALAHRTRTIWVRLPMKREADQLAWAGIAVLFMLGLWSLVDYPLRVPSLAALAALGAVWMGAPAAANAPSKRHRRTSGK